MTSIATPKDWAIPSSMEEWMRNQEKRLMHEERRPRVAKGSDLLGPGFAPHASEIQDWNSESARFGGFFFSTPGALNAPEAGPSFMGMVIAAREGNGVQQLFSHEVGEESHTWLRMFYTTLTSTTQYSAWVQQDGP